MANLQPTYALQHPVGYPFTSAPGIAGGYGGTAPGLFELPKILYLIQQGPFDMAGAATNLPAMARPASLTALDAQRSFG